MKSYKTMSDQIVNATPDTILMALHMTAVTPLQKHTGVTADLRQATVCYLYDKVLMVSFHPMMWMKNCEPEQGPDSI